MTQTRGSKRSRGVCADENRPLKVVKKVTKKKMEKSKPRIVEQAVSSGEQQTQQQTERPVLVSCRKAESDKLLQYLKAAVSTRQGTAVYIPGQPGTGKTLTVRNVLSRFPWRELQEQPPACTLVNCMDSVSCLARVCLAGLREAASSACSTKGRHSLPVVAANACTLQHEDNNDAMKEIRRIATGSSKLHKGMYVLVLDELDQACKRTNDSVAEIFSLSSLPRSRLIVISIANRLDLATRVLQPTGLAQTAAPHVVPFHSYTARQLLDLLEEQYPRQFQPRALELIAKRISAATGDMRTALAVCNAARTAAARGVRQQSSAGAALGSHSQSCDPNQGTSLDAGGNSSSIDVQQAGCESGSGAANTELISVSQAAEALRVCSSGGSAQAQGHVARIQALPTQQQLLLCTLAIARGAAQGATPAAPTPSAPASTFRALQLLGAAPSTPTLSVGAQGSTLSTSMRQGSISSLLAARRTPLAAVGGNRGFGLAGGSAVQVPKKAEFKSFPMPDDMPGFTPTSASAGLAGKKGAVATMTLKAAFEKYKVRGQEAGIKVMGSALQLESMVDDLKSAGLLEAAGKKGGRAAPRENMQLQLCVSTDDVKHALGDNRMLKPLVCQLP